MDKFFFLNGVFLVLDPTSEAQQAGLGPGSPGKGVSSPVTSLSRVGLPGKDTAGHFPPSDRWPVGHAGAMEMSSCRAPSMTCAQQSVAGEAFPMGLLGRETPGEGPGSCPPWSLSVPPPTAPALSPGPWGIWLVASYLPGPAAQREASPCPVPLLVAPCTSAFLECVCIGDICIFEVFKNLFS